MTETKYVKNYHITEENYLASAERQAGTTKEASFV